MSIEAGLCKYAELNDKIKQELRTKKKVTIKKLKKNRKYYVRIRTYKMINGKKYTSAWSKAKTVVVE